jgi:hypothetical protein
MVFSGFLNQENWLSRYNWNIVESGIKHHKPNNQPNTCTYLLAAMMLSNSFDKTSLISIEPTDGCVNYNSILRYWVSEWLLFPIK